MAAGFRTGALFLLLFTFVCAAAHAQDTESKDEITIITIYVKMQVEPSGCMECLDSLSEKIRRMDGADNIKLYKDRFMLTFMVPSCKVMGEDTLRNIISGSRLEPLSVEYNKEEIDIDPVQGPLF